MGEAPRRSEPRSCAARSSTRWSMPNGVAPRAARRALADADAWSDGRRYAGSSSWASARAGPRSPRSPRMPTSASGWRRPARSVRVRVSGPHDVEDFVDDLTELAHAAGEQVLVAVGHADVDLELQVRLRGSVRLAYCTSKLTCSMSSSGSA